MSPRPSPLSIVVCVGVLASASAAQTPGVVNLTPTPPPDVSYPIFADTSAAHSGPGTDFKDTGGGRGQALVDIVGPDPADPTNPDKVGPPDGILDLVQTNSNSPALPLGSQPGEWITPPIGTVHASCVVFRGAADGTFTDVTEWMSPEDADGFNIAYPCGSTWGVVASDYDDDGDLDLFFPCGGFNMDSPNTLLANDGDGTFTNVSAALGLDEVQVTFGAAFVDYDRDGDMDLFEANAVDILPTYYQGNASPDATDRLFRNDAGAAFTEVGASADVDLKGNGFSVSVSDLDRDGWPDLMLSCFRQYNKVYYNDGDGSFSFMQPRQSELTLDDLVPDPAFAGTFDFDVLQPAYEQYPIYPFWSMPVEIADFNADGWPDICVSAFSNQLEDHQGESALGALFAPADPTALYLNRGDQDGDGVGDGLFREVAAEVGIAHIGGCMGHIAGDFNGDGFIDMYMGGGGPQLDTHLEEDYLYINNGPSWPLDFQAEPDQALGQVFHEVGALAGTYANIFMAHGLTSYRSTGGRVDVLVGNGGPGLLDLGQPNLYYENGGNEDGGSYSFLEVELEASSSAPGGYGATVEVFTDRDSDSGRVLVREKRAGQAFACHNDGPLLFGMGEDGALAANVTWAGGVKGGAFLWPATQPGSLVFTEPTLSAGMRFSYPAGGGIDVVVDLEETGTEAFNGTLFFVSLHELAGAIYPGFALHPVPVLTLQPGQPGQLDAHLEQGLVRGLYSILVFDFSDQSLAAAWSVWHDPALVPGEGEPAGRTGRIARARHVTPAERVELSAATVEIASARLPLAWESIDATGLGERKLADGHVLRWSGGRVRLELAGRANTSLTLSAEAPLLTVGRPLGCCEVRHGFAGQLVRFTEVEGGVEVDGRSYAADGSVE